MAKPKGNRDGLRWFYSSRGIQFPVIGVFDVGLPLGFDFDVDVDRRIPRVLEPMVCSFPLPYEANEAQALERITGVVEKRPGVAWKLGKRGPTDTGILRRAMRQVPLEKRYAAYCALRDDSLVGSREYKRFDQMASSAKIEGSLPYRQYEPHRRRDPRPMYIGKVYARLERMKAENPALYRATADSVTGGRAQLGSCDRNRAPEPLVLAEMVYAIEERLAEVADREGLRAAQDSIRKKRPVGGWMAPKA